MCGINDGANGCAVETVEPDGTASLSSVFITLQGTEGERQGAVSATHPSTLSLHQHLGCTFTSPLLNVSPTHPDTLLLGAYLHVDSGHAQSHLLPTQTLFT